MHNYLSLFYKIAAVFAGSKAISQEDKAAAEKAIVQLSNTFNLLVQKAESLKKKYPEVVHRIRKDMEKIKFLKPDISVQAGKIEQDIAQKITCASSSCDSVLSGGNIKQLSDQLVELELLLKQRQSMKL
jgi:hypothetical protein